MKITRFWKIKTRSQESFSRFFDGGRPSTERLLPLIDGQSPCRPCRFTAALVVFNGRSAGVPRLSGLVCIPYKSEQEGIGWNSGGLEGEGGCPKLSPFG